jgi:hypothetical protein
MLKEITGKNKIDYSNIPTNSIDENLKNIVSIMKNILEHSKFSCRTGIKHPNFNLIS